MSTQNEVTVNGGGRQYGTKLTAKGAAALAACILEGTKLEITEIAVGDGGGAYYEPMSSQTALVHEVWRDEVLSCEKSVLNPNTMDIKGVIPSDAGGFVIREMGVFDAAGTLIGVCNTPDMEKTDAASGAGGKLDLIMHLVVTDADAVQVVIKSSLDAVSLEDVRELLKDKQDKLNGQEGQVPVFNKNGILEAQPLEQLLEDKQDKITGQPGQVPVFNKEGVLEAQDYSSSTVFAFAEEDWGPPASWTPEEPEEGEEAAAYDGSLGYEISVPAETHKRKTGDFGFHVFHQVDGRYITNTWVAIGTGANYDGESGTVTLSCSAPYPGKILFVG
ncbi:phage tail protein [uncultured Oscillibacter sp.]|uniref:phage tail-collar fiber domain-containing protein n=1 Tax=uncultured Oscillibacter sp. TaxID=876091 RepID=UPI00262C6250|nr:phage tail protein [uncultured Oscillibacter sp.]